LIDYGGGNSLFFCTILQWFIGSPRRKLPLSQVSFSRRTLPHTSPFGPSVPSRACSSWLHTSAVKGTHQTHQAVKGTHPAVKGTHTSDGVTGCCERKSSPRSHPQPAGTTFNMPASSLAEPLLAPSTEHHPPMPSLSPKRQLSSVLHMPKEALRGVPLNTLLQAGAALFSERGKAAREDPQGTYAKSQPVEVLDYSARILGHARGPSSMWRCSCTSISAPQWW
jgi:hypothetical protein